MVMAVTGCNPNSSIELKKIELVCTPFKSYVIGDHLMDEANTKIELNGYYSNGTSKPLSFDDVSFVLASNGNKFDPFASLTDGGSYTLKAKKSGVTSNAFTFNVAEQNTFVESIQYNGPSIAGIERPVEFTLSVVPSNNTELVLFSSANENIATVSQTAINSFAVTGHQTGSTIINFKARVDDTNYTEINCEMTIEDNYVTSMVAAGPNVIGIGSSVPIKLDVEPFDFTTEIRAQSNNISIVNTEKVDDKTFNLIGVSAGETDVRFFAKKNATEEISETFHVTVQNIAKTTIQQTYTQFNKKNYYTISGCPTSGDARLLVIPVWFNDSGSFIKEETREIVRQDIETAFFGSEEDTGWHSVASFYNEESKRELNLAGTVSEWYTVSSSASTYASDSSEQTNYLTIDAVNWYFANHTDSRTDYDSDGDGYLDGVMLIYAAPDYVTYKKSDSKHTGYGKDKENLWAYVSYTSANSNISRPAVNAYMWASYDFMYSASLSKDKTGYKYGYGDTAHCLIDAHTYIHEMGHIFGLEDYYDYAGLTSYAGRFSMQDYNVCGHDGFSALALGWADPYIPTSSCEITLNDFQSTHELILLTPQWNAYNSAFDEYLLLELYSPNGLNNQDVNYNYKKTSTAPNAVGIRLWHVDAKLFKASGNSGLFTSDVNVGKINNAFNNTSKTKAEGGRDCYAKPVSTYQDYNLLHLIRNNVLEPYQTNSAFKASDLFYADSSFSMETYQSQFLKGRYLDFNQNLGWSFQVNEITDYGTGQYSATIRLTKSL